MICQNCGVSFVVSDRLRRKYCSPRCKNSGGAKLRGKRNAQIAERRCYRCTEVKPTAEFVSLTHSYCRPCRNAYQRERSALLPRGVKAARRRRSYNREDPAKRNGNARRRRWGMPEEDFADLLASQGGGCAICATVEPSGRGTWYVDHDHTCCPAGRSCGRCIRGLLCTRCNVGLGNFQDDPDRLMHAARYLTQSPTVARR